ncbi:hypothetical protein K449DRAFT_423663 [Hypoxylon sp. EC38]|nr:hypothetical protein K449DRAFT_423663 [Hypoxylon sp. EC38]
MDHSEAKYTGLEPADPFAHMPNLFEAFSFDPQEAPTGGVSFESQEPPSSQNVAAPGNSTGPPTQDPVPAPVADQPVYEATPQYIDPRNLGNDNNITGIGFRQNNQDTTYFSNSGNIYPPMSNFPDPTNYTLNDTQYHPQQTNYDAYPGYDAVRAPYPAQGASYPVERPAYPIQRPAYPVQASPYPVQGLPYSIQVPVYPAQGPSYPPQGVYSTPRAPYSVPNAIPTVPEAGYTLPQGTLTMPPPPPMNIQQSSPPQGDRRISIDSEDGEARRGYRASKLPSVHLIFGQPPLTRPDKGPNGVTLRNDRIPRVTRKNQQRPDPRDWYGPLLPQPESWGPKDKTNRPLFKYTEFGELERGRNYSAREMRWYLFGPKKHEEQFQLPKLLGGVPVVNGKVRQGLTIWIGWVPPQSNDRYPYGAQSQRCRFNDCPDPNQTIRSGFPRITFDERMNQDGEIVDAFHNAGYAHLYCFEKHFDLVHAMICLDIRADHRNFKREENLGKLSRFHPEIHKEVEDWWRDEYPQFAELGKARDRSYEHSLAYRLVCHVLANSSDGRIKMRETRNGADMSKHKGDLIKQQFLKECIQHELVDEFGDPVPHAREELERIAAGKKQRKAIAKKLGARRNRFLPDISTEDGDDDTPLPTPTTVQQTPTPRNAAFSPELNRDLEAAGTMLSLYAGNMTGKRNMDQVEAEDQDIDMLDRDGHEPIRERPDKRRQVSSMIVSDSVPPAWGAPTAGDVGQQLRNGRYIERNTLPSEMQPGPGLHRRPEVETDDKAPSNSIDNKMSSGKFPSAIGVDRTTELHAKPEEIGPNKEQPSPAISLDAIELKEGDDLFADVALETMMLETEVKKEYENNDH